MTDREIIDAIRLGNDRQALEELYQRLLPKVRRMIGDVDEAEDVFQDALMVFYKQVKLMKFNERYEIAAFVFSVARNYWINRLKKMKRTIDLKGMDIPEYGKTELEEIMAREHRKSARELFTKLDPKCQELLTYTTLQNLSMEDVCQRMGYASVAAASTANFRCKKKLAELARLDHEFARTREL